MKVIPKTLFIFNFSLIKNNKCTVSEVKIFLEKVSKALFEWLENNLLKSNADKCKF